MEIESCLRDWIGDTNKLLGLNIRIKSSLYSNDSTGSSIKLEINGVNEDGSKINVNLEEFKKRCNESYYPDKLEWLDKEFQVLGNPDKWKIVGFKRSNRKYPYICKNLNDNKEYKLPMKDVRDAFAEKVE